MGSVVKDTFGVQGLGVLRFRAWGLGRKAMLRVLNFGMFGDNVSLHRSGSGSASGSASGSGSGPESGSEEAHGKTRMLSLCLKMKVAPV